MKALAHLKDCVQRVSRVEIKDAEAQAMWHFQVEEALDAVVACFEDVSVEARVKKLEAGVGVAAPLLPVKEAELRKKIPDGQAPLTLALSVECELLRKKVAELKSALNCACVSWKRGEGERDGHHPNCDGTGFDTSSKVKALEVEAPCARCGGCRQIANSDEGEPWIHWQNLPPGADLAVRMGIVKPIPCPDCSGG